MLFLVSVKLFPALWIFALLTEESFWVFSWWLFDRDALYKCPWSTSLKFKFFWWSVMLLINISIKWPVVWLFKCPWVRAMSSHVLVLWNQQTKTQRYSVYCHRRLRKPAWNHLMLLLLLIHWSAECCRCVGGTGLFYYYYFFFYKRLVCVSVC